VALTSSLTSNLHSWLPVNPATGDGGTFLPVAKQDRQPDRFLARAWMIERHRGMGHLAQRYSDLRPVAEGVLSSSALRCRIERRAKRGWPQAARESAEGRRRRQQAAGMLVE
jgi:hypothetical protein